MDCVKRNKEADLVCEFHGSIAVPLNIFALLMALSPEPYIKAQLQFLFVAV